MVTIATIWCCSATLCNKRGTLGNDCDDTLPRVHPLITESADGRYSYSNDTVPSILSEYSPSICATSLNFLIHTNVSSFVLREYSVVCHQIFLSFFSAHSDHPHQKGRYRVSKMHKMPYLCRSFPAKEPYD